MADTRSRRLIGQQEVLGYLGGITAMTLWRWRRRFPDFPLPVTISGRNYYEVAELDAWLDRQREAANAA